MKKNLTIITLLIFTLVLSGCGTNTNTESTSTSTSTSDSVFQQAIDESGCKQPICVLDSYRLRFDSMPYDDGNADAESFDYLKKILTKLGFSDDVYTKMIETEDTDGMQTTSTDTYTANWNYDKTLGLEVIFIQK
jgi:uncharacterized protein YceK